MPPKKKQVAGNAISCCICCQSIVKGKDEVLFCTGNCQQWLHRYCTNVTIQQYKDICSNNSPFQCPTCYRKHSKKPIDELTSSILALKLEVTQLKESLYPARVSLAELVRRVCLTHAGESTAGTSLHSKTGKTNGVFLLYLPNCAAMKELFVFI